MTPDNPASPVADIHAAWGIIANVSGGDWSQQSEEWQQAAKMWRDLEFHARWCDPAPSKPDAVIQERGSAFQRDSIVSAAREVDRAWTELYVREVHSPSDYSQTYYAATPSSMDRLADAIRRLKRALDEKST